MPQAGASNGGAGLRVWRGPLCRGLRSGPDARHDLLRSPGAGRPRHRFRRGHAGFRSVQLPPRRQKARSRARPRPAPRRRAARRRAVAHECGRHPGAVERFDAEPQGLAGAADAAGNGNATQRSSPGTAPSRSRRLGAGGGLHLQPPGVGCGGPSDPSSTSIRTSRRTDTTSAARLGPGAGRPARQPPQRSALTSGSKRTSARAVAAPASPPRGAPAPAAKPARPSTAAALPATA